MEVEKESHVTLLERAEATSRTDSPQSETLYKKLLTSYAESRDTDVQKAMEDAILGLAQLYVNTQKQDLIPEMLMSLRPHLGHISKAKSARIVRAVLDLVATVPKSSACQVRICEQVLEWTKEKKHDFLRQRLELRLAQLFCELREYEKSLDFINSLSREVKQVDDKALLIDIQLLEAQVYYMLHNLPKSKAALTGARTTASAIYCPPVTQGSIDICAGKLHADHDHDYKTALSYFLEAFEVYENLGRYEETVMSLNYMILCKVMLGAPGEVPSLFAGKDRGKYLGKTSHAMSMIVEAAKNRSVTQYESAKKEGAVELAADPFLQSHVNFLYEKLLEEDLKRVLEPFSRVELAHVAELVQLDKESIERKLSEMILDKKLNAIIDQGVGEVMLYDEAQSVALFDNAGKLLDCTHKIADALYEKAQKIY